MASHGIMIPSTVRGRLVLGFACIVAVTFLQGGVEIWHARRLKALLGEAYEATMREQLSGAMMMEAALTMRLEIGEITPLPQNRSAKIDAALGELREALEDSISATGDSEQALGTLALGMRSEEETGELAALNELNRNVEKLESLWNDVRAEEIDPVALDPLRRFLDETILPEIESYEDKTRQDLVADAATAMGIVNRGRTITTLAIVVAILIATGAGIVLARMTVHPLARLTGAADRIASQDPDMRMPEKLPGEFGDLAVAFNRMLDALRATTISRNELETVVGERTREIDQFFRLSLDLMCVADKSGRFLRVNDAFVDTLGYSREELTSRPYLDFVHPDDADATLAEMEKLQQTRDFTIRFDNRYRHKDGSWRNLSWNAVPVPDADLVYASARDVTELKAAERKLLALNNELEDRAERRAAELSASEEQFRLAMENSAIGMALVSTSGAFLRVNAALCALLGYESAELLELDFQAITHPDDLESDLDHVRRILAGEIPTYQMEKRYFRKDGATVWALLVVTLTHDEAGRPGYFVSQIQDITDRKRVEKVQREALDLQRELTRRAQVGERAKSEFLAVMSHEIRTPMNGLIGYAELLARAEDLSPENHDYALTLHQSGRALLRILDDILDFTASEAGSLQLQEMPFAPREVLTEVQHLLRPNAAAKGLNLRVEISPGIPEQLVGDSGRLRQILLNLASNGVKFTEAGEVVIAASADSAAGKWSVAVRDTGRGISADHRNRIFQPFMQADSSNSRRQGGTGLGLAISKRLSELMGGTLDFRNGSETGSEFLLQLPMRIAAPAVEPSFGTPLPVGFSKDFARQHPLDILVVEDDPVNSKLTVTLLRRLGYEPRTAFNGVEAVKRFEERHPTCILMDLQMPEMDGIEATRAIRAAEKQSERPPVFIAALTANTVPEDREHCFGAGMTAYVNKPIRREHLLKTLVAASEQARAWCKPI